MRKKSFYALDFDASRLVAFDCLIVLIRVFASIFDSSDFLYFLIFFSFGACNDFILFSVFFFILSICFV